MWPDQFVFKVIHHDIWNRSSVFGILVQAPQHLPNIHSWYVCTGKQKATSPLDVNSLKNKKKKKEKKYKNIAELFSKST